MDCGCTVRLPVIPVTQIEDVTIVDEGPLQIVYCPLHKAAWELLEAAKAIEALGVYGPLRSEEFETIQAAIKAATEGTGNARSKTLVA